MGDEIRISISGRARVDQVIGKIEAGEVRFDSGVDQLLVMLRGLVDDAARDGRLSGSAATTARTHVDEARQALDRPDPQERKEGLRRALRGLAETVRFLPDLTANAQQIINLIQGFQ